MALDTGSNTTCFTRDSQCHTPILSLAHSSMSRTIYLVEPPAFSSALQYNTLCLSASVVILAVQGQQPKATSFPHHSSSLQVRGIVSSRYRGKVCVLTSHWERTGPTPESEGSSLTMNC